MENYEGEKGHYELISNEEYSEQIQSWSDGEADYMTHHHVPEMIIRALNLKMNQIVEILSQNHQIVDKMM
ncbi:unnamed protein product [Arabis nemorensis]|uniref:Uncharacterized protein n=1 Tax=Arabis nemorensis TaxID=586526 RepID=A0A565AUU8_9BRAS|nr:unnamed protein product [Arabis nemorensis]